MTEEAVPRSSSEFPAATVHARAGYRLWQRFPRTRWWLLAFACLVIAIVLIAAAWRARGPTILVRFSEGHGIRPGDTLRYRGIEVGTVIEVALSNQLDGVQLQLELEPNAANLAREGSRFWIVRPEVSLTRVRGLETVMGPKYVAVAPGLDDAPRQSVFQGEDVPVMLADTTQQEIRIRFANGNGLQVGDELRYRGIAVGEVSNVELNSAGNGVTVQLRLASSAAWLARAGSQFWVERPRISFQGIGGLETLIGGRYLGVQPGPENAARQTTFVGLDVAPIALERRAGGLDIVLESPQRLGLAAGAPVSYRGVEVGKILAVQLAGDAAHVEAHAYLYPEYKSLVRSNTRFWSTSGIDLQIGVRGVRLTADTLATIAAGGVALATPEEPGDTVSTGHRFTLERAADDAEEWQEWQPRLAVGDILLPEGAPLPRPQRGQLNWQRKRLGIRRAQQREGWLLVLDNQRLLAPADLLVPPENAEADSAVLELAGRRVPLASASVLRAESLARLQLPSAQLDVPTWRAAQLRIPAQPEDCLVVAANRQRNLPLTAARLQVEGALWQLDPALPLDDDLHGAAVVATRDGAVIGLVIVEPKRRYIAPLNAALLESSSP